MKIVLKYPFTTAAGKRLTEVEMRRATRGDLKAAHRYSKDEIEQEDFLLARLTGLVPEDLDPMDVADSRVLSDAFRTMVDGGKGNEDGGRNIAAGAADATV